MSPVGWPWTSLTDLKSSRSARISPTVPAEPLGARELGREHLVGVAAVREAGEPVDERLALDDPVQPRVLERDHRLLGERGAGHPLLGRRTARRRASGGRSCADRPRARTRAARRPRARRRSRRRSRPRRSTTPPPRLGRLDSRLDDHAAELLRVERLRERVAEAGVRLSQAAALLLEIVQPRLELRGHLVERATELRELVASLDRHPLAKAAGCDRVRGACEPSPASRRSSGRRHRRRWRSGAESRRGRPAAARSASASRTVIAEIGVKVTSSMPLARGEARGQRPVGVAVQVELLITPSGRSTVPSNDAARRRCDRAVRADDDRARRAPRAPNARARSRGKRIGQRHRGDDRRRLLGRPDERDRRLDGERGNAADRRPTRATRPGQRACAAGAARSRAVAARDRAPGIGVAAETLGDRAPRYAARPRRRERGGEPGLEPPVGARRDAPLATSLNPQNAAASGSTESTRNVPTSLNLKLRQHRAYALALCRRSSGNRCRRRNGQAEPHGRTSCRRPHANIRAMRPRASRLGIALTAYELWRRLPPSRAARPRSRRRSVPPPASSPPADRAERVCNIGCRRAARRPDAPSALAPSVASALAAACLGTSIGPRPPRDPLRSPSLDARALRGRSGPARRGAPSGSPRSGSRARGGRRSGRATSSGAAASRRCRIDRQAPMFCGSSCAQTSSRRFGYAAVSAAAGSTGNG